MCGVGCLLMFVGVIPYRLVGICTLSIAYVSLGVWLPVLHLLKSLERSMSTFHA